MATVSPVVKRTTEGISYVIWEGVVTGDTLTAFALPEQWGLAGSIQLSGTFGGATAKLQHSNNALVWFDASDLGGTAVSATANAIFEISLSSAYFRPAVTSGSANDIDIIMVLRGLY